MKRILSDDEIKNLIGERKALPRGWETRLQPRPKSDIRFAQREWETKSEAGHVFRVILRQSTMNPFDFSVILIFRDADGSEFRLCRYNGRHPSEHTNKWEKSRQMPNSKFRNVFHIHMATERYQQEGYDIDSYAEPTNDYTCFEGAVKVFLERNNFAEELPLFDNRGARQ